MENRRPGKARLLVSLIENNEPQLAEGMAIFLAPEYMTTKKAIILAIGDCSASFNVGDRCTIMGGSGVDIGGKERILHESEILFTETL